MDLLRKKGILDVKDLQMGYEEVMDFLTKIFLKDCSAKFPNKCMFLAGKHDKAKKGNFLIRY